MVSPGFNVCEPQQRRRGKMQSIGMAIALLIGVWTVGAVNVEADQVKILADRVRSADRVRILDKCDPATFNANGPVLCDPNFDGAVTLEDFSELLTPAAFGHPAWRFNAPYLAIDPDERVRVTNRGGEEHTFTEVLEVEEGKSPFGGGRVDALNQPLGLTGLELPICLDATQSPVIPAGESVQIKKTQ
jgi:hypothetical protein